MRYCVRLLVLCVFFFFQAEDGIRDLVRSRGLGDVYKRQARHLPGCRSARFDVPPARPPSRRRRALRRRPCRACLLYTSDAADDLLCVDLGGRRIIKKKKTEFRSYEHLELQDIQIQNIMII